MIRIYCTLATYGTLFEGLGTQRANMYKTGKNHRPPGADRPACVTPFTGCGHQVKVLTSALWLVVWLRWCLPPPPPPSVHPPPHSLESPCSSVVRPMTPSSGGHRPRAPRRVVTTSQGFSEGLKARPLDLRPHDHLCLLTSQIFSCLSEKLTVY